MIYSIGEALLDLIPCAGGKSLEDAEVFSKQAGGAPANVAAAVARLGGRAAFISKIGNDGFGRFIVRELQSIGVNVDYVSYSDEYATGIVFVALNSNGDREFCSIRQNSADLYLNQDEIDTDIFTADDILHFCSVSLAEAPVKYAHIKAIEDIINKGGRVSFDVNLRLMLWKNRQDCIDTVWDFMKYPDYLKISDDEVNAIMATDNYDMAIKHIFDNGNRLKLIVLSMGSKGSSLYYRDGRVYHIGAYKANAIDTTGAGDCFWGSVLYGLDELECEPETKHMLAMLQFASAAAAIQVGRYGAMTSLPTKQEIVDYIENNV